MNLKILLLILILTLGILGFAFVFNKVNISNQNVNQTSNITTNTKETRCENLKYKYENEFTWKDEITITNPHIKDVIFLSFGDIEYFKNLSKVQLDIQKIKFNKETNSVIYLAGKVEIGKPRSIRVYNLDSKVDKELFKFVSSELPKGNAYLGNNILTDFNISEDGKLIAITTNQKVYIYDLNKNQEVETYIFTKQMNTAALSDPVFSLDNKNIILKLRYYEGASNVLLDLKTGEFERTAYSGYGSGSEVLGWSKSKLIVYEYGDGSKYYLGSSKSTEKNLATLNFYYHKDYLVQNNYIYVIGGVNAPSGQKVCNNAMEPYEVSTVLDTLFKISFEGNVQTLARLDATDSSGVPQITNFKSMRFIDLGSGQKLIAKIMYKEKDYYAIVNESGENNFSLLKF